jgi:hypothetical protein
MLLLNYSILAAVLLVVARSEKDIGNSGNWLQAYESFHRHFSPPLMALEFSNHPRSSVFHKQHSRNRNKSCTKTETNKHTKSMLYIYMLWESQTSHCKTNINKLNHKKRTTYFQSNNKWQIKKKNSFKHPSLLVCDVMSVGNYLRTFRRRVVRL